MVSVRSTTSYDSWEMLERVLVCIARNRSEPLSAQPVRGSRMASILPFHLLSLAMEGWQFARHGEEIRLETAAVLPTFRTAG